MKFIHGLILTVSVAGLKAQEPPACDTLVLKNKKVLSVHLDSVKGDVVYYRHCPDDDGRIRSLPLGYLKSIRGTSSVMDTLPKNQDGQVLLKKAPPHTQVWTFSSRDESKPIILSGASEVRIHYKDNKVKMRRKGYIKSMEGDSVLLQTQRFGLLSIPKSKVTEISIPKNSGTTSTVFGSIFLLMALGIIAVFGFILAFVFLLTGGAAPDGDTKGTSRTGCLVGFLLGSIGIVLLLLSRPRSIQVPFSDRWKITTSTTGEAQKGDDHVDMPRP